VKYYLSIHFKTSGFYDKGGYPVEFGCVLLDKDTFKPKSVFRELVRFAGWTYKWYKAAEKYNNITREDCEKYGNDLADVWKHLEEWLQVYGVALHTPGEVILCGYNMSFEMPFFEMLCGSTVFPTWASHVYRDVMQWAMLLNRAHEIAFGREVMPFQDKSGNTSVSMGTVASALGVAYECGQDTVKAAITSSQIMKKLLYLLSEDLKASSEYELKKGKIG
jgi:hypothetical protein